MHFPATLLPRLPRGQGYLICNAGSTDWAGGNGRTSLAVNFRWAEQAADNYNHIPFEKRAYEHGDKKNSLTVI
jgi:hypothetical protein